MWLECSEEKEMGGWGQLTVKPLENPVQERPAYSGKTISPTHQHDRERNTHGNYLRALASDSPLVISYVINFLFLIGSHFLASRSIH